MYSLYSVPTETIITPKQNKTQFLKIQERSSTEKTRFYYFVLYICKKNDTCQPKYKKYKKPQQQKNSIKRDNEEIKHLFF